MASDSHVPGSNIGTRAGYSRSALLQIEGGSPSGSYESNTAIPQAFYTKQSGAGGIVTGGAGGVWISAIGHAASLFGLKGRVYSVRKPGSDHAWGDAFGRVWGVDVQASPSQNTRV